MRPSQPNRAKWQPKLGTLPLFSHPSIQRPPTIQQQSGRGRRKEDSQELLIHRHLFPQFPISEPPSGSMLSLCMTTNVCWHRSPQEKENVANNLWSRIQNVLL